MWSAFQQIGEWDGLVFGRPCLLLTADGVTAVMGPHGIPPREWLWEVYSAPTPWGRYWARKAMQTLRSGAPRRVLVANGFIGVRTVATYFLLARDAEGPYVVARASLAVGVTDRETYRELVRVAERLREGGRRRLSAGESG